MLKSREELRKFDVTPYCESRGERNAKGQEIIYLNWAKCVDLLYMNGAEKVEFTPIIGDDGSSLLKSDKVFTDKNGNTNQCYEVAVQITIDNDTFIQRSPLMNGVNPVKDNSLTQQRVGNAQMRAFVKGVAIHTGLGFGLWADGCGDDIDNFVEDDLGKHSLMKIKERLQVEYTALLKKGKTAGDIARDLDMDVETVKTLFTYPDILDRFEKKLVALK